MAKKAKTNSKKVTKKESKKQTFDITEHILIPEHRILSKNEAEELLRIYHISEHQLPLIRENDPVTKALNAKKGNILEIVRKGPLNDHAFYRRVI